MTVHDVGTYRTGPLKPGQVFSIDPMLWVPEERLYVRVEDVVVVTETGVENFTDFLAVAPAAIEAIVAEPGMVQWRGATSLPLKR
jgi:Xaa-Pro aminopeptidase